MNNDPHTVEPEVAEIVMRGNDAVALSLIEIAQQLVTMQARGTELPDGPIMGNHINNLLTAACERLALNVGSGQFYIFQRAG